MIYDIIAYSKPTDVPQNIGSVIKKLRVSAEKGETIDLVSIINQFFSDVDLASLTVPEPAITLMGSLSKVATNEEVNDTLATLRYYGIYFLIVELPSLSEEATDEPGIQCTSYLLLQKSYKADTYSVPVMYVGTSINFRTVPTVGIMMLELAKQLPLPNTFGKFTDIKSLLEFYSNVGADDQSYVRINGILNAFDALGYTYLGLIL